MTAPAERDQLEASLVANPDDRATHAAYADWLMEDGDPRGEFIQVQLALEDEGLTAASRKKLRQREQRLLTAHERAWLGGLADALLEETVYGKPQFRYARGWLDAAEFTVLTGKQARALSAAPEARLLRRLGVSATEDWSMTAEDVGSNLGDRFPGLEPLVESPYVRNLRYFRWGGASPLGDDDFTYNTAFGPGDDGVEDLVPELPLLEELYVNNYNDINAGKLFGLKTLSHLRVLQFCLGEEYPLETLASNRSLGRLTSLLLHPQSIGSGDDPRITRAGVVALLNSPHLKSLTQLRVHQTDLGDAGCAEIVRCGILKRLKVLDLAWGSITDAGARTLAACPDLKNLEYLDLSRNALTANGIAALKKAVGNLRAEEQHDADDETYLYEGDIE